MFRKRYRKPTSEPRNSGNFLVDYQLVFRFSMFEFYCSIQVVIPYRGDPYMVNEGRTSGDLGQILFSHFHLEDDDSIRRAMKYSDVVINCIGSEINTLNFTIERCNVVGARRIARIAREMGIKKLIHISSLGASPNPRVRIDEKLS